MLINDEEKHNGEHHIKEGEFIIYNIKAQPWVDVV
jgi:hypothetical protein